MKRLFISIVISVLIFTGCSASVSSNELQESGSTTTIVKNMDSENPDLEFNRIRILNNEGYINLSYINDMVSFIFWSDAILLKSTGIKKLYVYINSWGGSIDASFSIVSTIEDLKKSGVTVVVEAPGLVASAAIPVYCSASIRIASKNTVFMMHSLSFRINTQKEGEGKLLFNKNYARIVAKYSNLTEDMVLQFVENEIWLSADMAKEYNMVDIIK